VFKNASTYPILLIIINEKKKKHSIAISYKSTEEDILKNTIMFNRVPQSYFANREDRTILIDCRPEIIRILGKIEAKGVQLRDLVELKWGTSSSGYGNKKISQEAYQRLNPPEQENYVKIVQSADIKWFRIEWKGEYIQSDVFPENQLKLFTAPKIVISRQSKELEAGLDDKGEYALGKVAFTSNLLESIDLHYLLACLNSKIIDFYFKKMYESLHMSGGYIRYDIPYLYQLPIATSSDAQLLDELHSLGEKLMDVSPKTPQYRNALDSIFYTLYGLNEKDIRYLTQKI